MKKIDHFINGTFLGPNSETYLDNFNPTTGEVYSKVASGNAADVEKAYQAAKQAFTPWSQTPAAQRAHYLRAIADEIEVRLEEFALAESRDQGKPVQLARTVDIPRAIYNFRFFADALLTREEKAFPMDAQALNYTIRRPLGVAGLISPWNLPLYLLTWKIAPAIAYGNTCIAKPSELTPFTAAMLGEVLQTVQLPSGVVNIVHGLGQNCGQAIVAHPDIPLISFTGGTQTAKAIASTAAPLFKKLSLELGGKNAAVVFADANITEAATELARSSFANQGEICLCSERIYVQEAIFEEFVTAFTREAKKWTVGDPQLAGTKVGPLVSKEHRQKVQDFVDEARLAGAKIAVGGDPIQAAGYFFAPTVLTGVAQNCRIVQEEVFGPVVSILPFTDESQALELANDSKYGLSASIWGSDIRRLHRFAADIDAGTVWVNTWMLRDLRAPFGGMKASGMGRESAQESYEFFTEVKNICIKL